MVLSGPEYRKIVFGDGISNREDAYAQGTDDLPLLPQHIYGLSKKIGGELAEF
jgi:hypothetical protein